MQTAQAIVFGSQIENYVSNINDGNKCIDPDHWGAEHVFPE